MVPGTWCPGCGPPARGPWYSGTEHTVLSTWSPASSPGHVVPGAWYPACSPRAWSPPRAPQPRWRSGLWEHPLGLRARSRHSPAPLHDPDTWHELAGGAKTVPVSLGQRRDRRSAGVSGSNYSRAGLVCHPPLPRAPPAMPQAPARGTPEVLPLSPCLGTKLTLLGTGYPWGHHRHGTEPTLPLQTRALPPQPRAHPCPCAAVPGTSRCHFGELGHRFSPFGFSCSVLRNCWAAPRQLTWVPCPSVTAVRGQGEVRAGGPGARCLLRPICSPLPPTQHELEQSCGLHTPQGAGPSGPGTCPGAGIEATVAPQHPAEGGCPRRLRFGDSSSSDAAERHRHAADVPTARSRSSSVPARAAGGSKRGKRKRGWAAGLTCPGTQARSAALLQLSHPIGAHRS